MARLLLRLLCLSWPLAGVGATDASHMSSGGCVHGSKEGDTCVCADGWAGDTCDTPEDLYVEPKGKPVKGETCGLGFTVYPYGQQELWGDSYEGWEECNGMKQSPIDIVHWETQRKQTRRALNTSYSEDTNLYVKNTGSGLKIPGSWGPVTIDGEAFESIQFHFHAPSENSINGQLAAAEMHIVHLNAAGTGAAVVGLMFDVGEENECMAKIVSRQVPRAGCKRSIEDLDLNCFDYQLKGPWWNWEGSLTTPPCNEIVNWNLLQRRVEISQGQLNWLLRRYPLTPGNARVPQPLNGRKVVYYDPKP